MKQIARRPARRGAPRYVEGALRVALIFQRVSTFNQLVRGLVHGCTEARVEKWGRRMARARTRKLACDWHSERAVTSGGAGRTSAVKGCAGEGRRLPAATRARRTELRLQVLHGTPTIHARPRGLALRAIRGVR